MEWLTDPQVWMALVTLTALEIVLGIDNIIFISIQASKLPAHQQEKARLVGLGLAMFIRIALLFSLTWLMGLTCTAVHGHGQRDFRSRPDPHLRRSVSALEKHHGDPREA